MNKKLEKKWAEWKPTVIYLGVCTAVTGTAILIGRDAVSKGLIQRLNSENKHLKNELQMAEEVAWDWYGFSLSLLQKYQVAPEDCEAMAKSWRESKMLAS